jgi:hypothetical protein
MRNKKIRVRVMVVFFLVGMAAPVTAGAQSLADVIEQLVLDYEKLSQLKKTLGNMYSAYTVVSKGYEDIKNIAEGNFNLHRDFLNGLLAVSPVVRDYAKVAAILDKEASLVEEYKAASRYFQGNGRWSSAELDYFQTVYGNLLSGSVRNLDELTMVVTAGELRMSDAERLAAIDRIDRDMTDRLNFLRVFNNSGAIQAGQRGIEQNNIGVLRSLYGVKN